MTHGWPGSVIELLETVGPLTDPTAHGGTPEDAFHLVLPSLPGYGFSGEPAELGWDASRTARAWAELMHRLGYTRYVAQGGDVGALVTDLMGRQAVEGLVGYHLNLLTAVLAIGDQLPKESEQERAAAEAVATFREDGFGYFLEMATRPQTIGYALLDSPVALAAWLLDHDTDSYYKISRAFVDGEPVGNLTRDTIVDNITLYWLTGTGSVGGPVVLGGRTSAGRSACERPASSGGLGSGRLHDVPRRDLGYPAQLGRGGLPRPRLLQRGRQGRPLRRLGGAGALLHRGAGRIQLTALTDAIVFGSLQEEVRCQHRPLISCLLIGTRLANGVRSTRRPGLRNARVAGAPELSRETRGGASSVHLGVGSSTAARRGRRHRGGAPRRLLRALRRVSRAVAPARRESRAGRSDAARRAPPCGPWSGGARRPPGRA